MKFVLYLKKYFPELCKTIRQQYPLYKLDEAVFLYKNSIDQPPICLICQKSLCKFKCHSTGYHNYCSSKCAKFHKRILTIQNHTIDYNNWRKYYHQTWRYTNISYQKFYNQINPHNHLRTIGKNGYQLDHILPITYGFLNKISPKIIGHFLNLRIISCKENASKGGKNILSSHDTQMHLKKLQNYIEDYYGC
jgi:hypothetical protein